MNQKLNYSIVTLLLLLMVGPVLALEVDREVMPRISLGGQVISTVDAVDLDSDPDAESDINLSDSSLLLGLDKRLYGKGVAGGVLGLTNTHDGAVFHQLHAFYWDRDTKWTLGQSRLQNTLVEFPLVRDDDLLAYTHVGNASSDEEFDQIYGKQLAFDWYVDRKLQSLGLWIGSRHDGLADAPAGFDSMGLGYRYEQSEDKRYVTTLRHAGLMLDRQKLVVTGDEEWISAIIAGVEFNLNMNPVANWSMGLQLVANGGLNDALDLGSVSAQARSKSNSFVSSLRYTHRPHLLTRWQAGLTIAHKNFSEVGDATQWSMVPSLFYRLGQGIDLLAQAAYTDYGEGLGGGSDKRVQLGIVFSLESVFNDNIGERNSILNLEHGYIQ